MNYLKCTKCGASIPNESDKKIGFCTFCGAKLVSAPQIVSDIPDRVILDYYVNAVESEIAHNNELAEHNYRTILSYRPDYAPAKRGLERVSEKKNTEPIVVPSISQGVSESINNVQVSFSSVKPYTLFVSFDEGKENLSLLSGDAKEIYLSPEIEHQVNFRIGRRSYNRSFVIESKEHVVVIDYLFNGTNHISITDNEGNDYSDWDSSFDGW